MLFFLLPKRLRFVSWCVFSFSMPSAPSDSGDSEYSEGLHSNTGSEYDSDSYSDSDSGSSSENSRRDQSESEKSIPSTKQSADNKTIFYEDLMSSSESEGSERESGSHEALAAVQETSAQTHKGRKKSSAKSTAGTVQSATAGTEKIVHYSLDNADSLEKVIAELRERQQLLQTLAGANAPSQPPTASTKSPAAKKAVKPTVASAPAPKATATSALRGVSKIRRDQLKRLAGLKKILDKAVTSYNDLAASIEQTE